MNNIRLSSEPMACDEDIKVIEHAVDNFNIHVTERSDYFPVHIFLRSEDATIVGGVLGDCWGEWFHVTYLWVAEAVRGQGYGTQLLQAAEDEARAYGCQAAYLETYSFQARPFYERLGYRLFAQLDNFPPGHTFYLMKKAL